MSAAPLPPVAAPCGAAPVPLPPPSAVPPPRPSADPGLPDLPRLEELTHRYVGGWGQASLAFEPILKGGSGRAFHRVRRLGSKEGAGPSSAIAMAYTLEREENARFEGISDFLRDLGVAVPALLARDLEDRVLWIEDLGTSDLWSLREEDWSGVRAPLYRAVLAEVSRLHAQPEDRLPAGIPELQPGFDAALYAWEQDYFFEQFAARFCEADAETTRAVRESAELRELVDELSGLPRFLIHRDFQSQNILISGEKPWLIDYQGMRLGRPEYDLASLLYDPYVPLSSAEREEMLRYYHRELASIQEPWESFARRVDRCAVQRLMQALGAYGFLGMVKGQRAFLEHIPTAVARLREAAVTRGALPGLASLLPA